MRLAAAGELLAQAYFSLDYVSVDEYDWKKTALPGQAFTSSKVLESRCGGVELFWLARNLTFLSTALSLGKTGVDKYYHTYLPIQRSH
jgi:hypothetical protein